MPQIKKIIIETKAGPFFLEMAPGGLYAIHFPNRKKTGRPSCKRPAFAWVKRFAKRRLDLNGYTPFQRRVYRTLMKVPSGEVITYGELARMAGYPGAARAVGSALKKNRLPIIIPCHRVISASGGIGEYSAGKVWKRLLLEHEHAAPFVSVVKHEKASARKPGSAAMPCGLHRS